MKVETHCILFLRLSAQKLLREIRLNFKLQIVFLQDIVQIKKKKLCCKDTEPPQ